MNYNSHICSTNYAEQKALTDKDCIWFLVKALSIPDYFHWVCHSMFDKAIQSEFIQGSDFQWDFISEYLIHGHFRVTWADLYVHTVSDHWHGARRRVSRFSQVYQTRMNDALTQACLSPNR